MRFCSLISCISLRSYFVSFLDQRSPNLVRVYGSDRNLQRLFPIDDALFQSGDIRDQVAKLSEIAQKLWRF